MYRNLEAEIVRNSLSKWDIAKAIGKSYNTFNLKLKGKSPFTYDEALTIQEKFFSEIDLKKLFAK